MGIVFGKVPSAKDWIVLRFAEECPCWDKDRGIRLFWTRENSARNIEEVLRFIVKRRLPIDAVELVRPHDLGTDLFPRWLAKLAISCEGLTLFVDSDEPGGQNREAIVALVRREEALVVMEDPWWDLSRRVEEKMRAFVMALRTF